MAIAGVRLDFDDEGNATAIIPEIQRVAGMDPVCLHMKRCGHLLLDTNEIKKRCTADNDRPVYEIMEKDRGCPMGKWWVCKWETVRKDGDSKHDKKGG